MYSIISEIFIWELVFLLDSIFFRFFFIFLKLELLFELDFLFVDNIFFDVRILLNLKLKCVILFRSDGKYFFLGIV